MTWAEKHRLVTFDDFWQSHERRFPAGHHTGGSHRRFFARVEGVKSARACGFANRKHALAEISGMRIPHFSLATQASGPDGSHLSAGNGQTDTDLETAAEGVVRGRKPVATSGD